MLCGLERKKTDIVKNLVIVESQSLCSWIITLMIKKTKKRSFNMYIQGWWRTRCQKGFMMQKDGSRVSAPGLWLPKPPRPHSLNQSTPSLLPKHPSPPASLLSPSLTPLPDHHCFHRIPSCCFWYSEHINPPPHPDFPSPPGLSPTIQILAWQFNPHVHPPLA